MGTCDVHLAEIVNPNTHTVFVSTLDYLSVFMRFFHLDNVVIKPILLASIWNMHKFMLCGTDG